MSSAPGNSGDEANEPPKVKFIVAGTIAFMLFGTLFLYLLIFGSDSGETNLSETSNGTELEPEKAAGPLQELSPDASQLPDETTTDKQQESLQPVKPTQPEKKAACGNGIIEEGETQQTCCQDTGCSQGFSCGTGGNCACSPSPESCDNLDNDCDGVVDEGVKATYFADMDKDGYGTPSSTLQACSQPSGHATNSQDCDDSNAAIKPSAAETCNSADDNCNGQADEGGVCQAATAQVKVLVMSYFPLQGSNLDSGITGMSDSLASIRSKVSQLTANTADSLTKGSTYHGYKDSNAKPSLQYTITDKKEFLKAEPVSTNQIPWNPNAFRSDYRLMLTSDVNVCDYVDNQNVKEVWVWGYHHGNIEPVESNMAMGTASQAYWNHGSYGDVSNSEQIDDLPTCTKSYTLYNYNYGRELGESLENHGHHIESLFGFIDATLWNKFQYPFGEPVPVVNSCGWTHTGPNSKEQYDPGWTSETTLKSNCEDWHPDGSGEVKDVNCHTWYGQTCLFNSGVEFKIWWMQNIPGANNGMAYQGRQMRSWWEFIADFDSAIAKGKSLTS